VVKRLIRASVETTEWINDNPDDAKELVNKGILEVTGAALPAAVIDAAWPNLKSTYDPITSSLFGSAESAKQLAFIDEVPDANIYALILLNEVLTEKALPEIQVEGGG
jgi:NitT/TauT family transport system substrate-binding protein